MMLFTICGEELVRQKIPPPALGPSLSMMRFPMITGDDLVLHEMPPPQRDVFLTITLFLIVGDEEELQ